MNEELIKKKRESITTTHKQIADYWKNKCITYDGAVGMEHELPYDKTIPAIEDIGEPCCMGCGKPIDLSKYKSYNDVLIDSPTKLWNLNEVKSKLYKCHIIPDSLGGKDKPENLFLMCDECHRLSPDTDNPKNFLRWIYRRREESGYFVKDIDINAFFQEFLEECLRQHKDPYTVNTDIKNRVSNHGGSIAQSSLIYAYVDTCKSIFREENI